jgi:hypothetical protein
MFAMPLVARRELPEALGDALVQWLNTPDATEGSFVTEALMTIGKLGPVVRSAAVKQAVLALLDPRGGGGTLSRALAALESMSRDLPDPEVLDVLLRFIQLDFQEVVRGAIDALYAMGFGTAPQRVAPIFLEVLEGDRSPDVKLEILHTVALWEFYDPALLAFCRQVVLRGAGSVSYRQAFDLLSGQVQSGPLPREADLLFPFAAVAFCRILQDPAEPESQAVIRLLCETHDPDIRGSLQLMAERLGRAVSLPELRTAIRRSAREHMKRPGAWSYRLPEIAKALFAIEDTAACRDLAVLVSSRLPGAFFRRLRHPENMLMPVVREPAQVIRYVAALAGLHRLDALPAKTVELLMRNWYSETPEASMAFLMVRLAESGCRIRGGPGRWKVDCAVP